MLRGWGLIWKHLIEHDGYVWPSWLAAIQCFGVILLKKSVTKISMHFKTCMHKIMVIALSFQLAQYANSSPIIPTKKQQLHNFKQSIFPIELPPMRWTVLYKQLCVLLPSLSCTFPKSLSTEHCALCSLCMRRGAGITQARFQVISSLPL